MKATKYGLSIELKEDFTQAQYEDYQIRFMDGAKDKTAPSVVERSIVQAAVDSKILLGVMGNLIDYPPRVIRWLTKITSEFIKQQIEVKE